jgi:putative ABC transport system permease protein
MKWAGRLWNTLRNRGLDGEIEEELQFHLTSRTQDNLARGMNPAEAQDDAHRRFGNRGLTLERAREAKILMPVQDLGQDVRFATRLFRRCPGFTVLVVLLLGLGIGASTAMFSLLMHVVFPMNSFENSPRLVFLWRFDKGQGNFLERLSWLDLNDIRGQSRSLEKMSIYRFDLLNVNATGEPESIRGLAIDPDWLSTVGISPTIGRSLMRGERDVTLLTSGLAKRLFQTNKDAIGRTLRIGNRPFTVIGVLPESFDFDETKMLVPLVPESDARQRESFTYHALAQMHSGVTQAQAEAEVASIVPGRDAWTVRLVNSDEMFAHECGPTCGQQHRGAWLLFGAAAVILLLACANVANLLLSRSIGRSREFVIRTAIGCSRHRLIRQMVTESLVLFGCGSAFGVLLAYWFSTLLVRFAAAYLDSVPAANAGLLDPRALAFVALATLITALLFGLAPAMRFTSALFGRGFRHSRATSATRGQSSVRGVLIAIEFALSMVLLIGFGLLLRSFLRVESIPVGIRTDHLLTISTNLAKYPEMPERIALASKLLDRARALPAVASAVVTSSLPLTGADDTQIRIEGSTDAPTEVRYLSVSANYFEAMGIPMIYGRPLSEQDSAGAAAVIVINQTMARALFPDGAAIGRRIQMEDAPTVWREIVGVAADVRQRNLEEDSRPVFYRPYTQGIDFDLSLAVRVRSGEEVSQVARALRKAAREMAPQIGWQPVKSMRQIIYESESLSLRRPIVRFLAAFGLMALMLTATGLFAVLSQSVAERTREIGIRMAVGARPRQVLRQILGEMVGFTIPGVCIGVGCAYLLSTLLPSGHIGWSGSGVFLYGIDRLDVSTYLGVFLILCFISVVAVAIPARRATLVDPWFALREQ